MPPSRRDRAARLSLYEDDDERVEEESGTAGPSGEYSNTPSEPPQQLQDDEAEYERLLIEVKKRRRQEAIEAIRAELADESSATVVEIEGLSTQYKHVAFSASPYVPPAHRPCLVELSIFSGKSLKELSDYQTEGKTHLKTIKFPTEKQEIAIAVTYLRDDAILIGSRDDKSINNGKDYIIYLRKLVVDSVNRKIYALICLKILKQGSGQSVRELVNHIKELEADISSMSEQKVKTGSLFNCLFSEIYIEVIYENKKILSCKQIIAVTQRQEKFMKQCFSVSE